MRTHLVLVGLLILAACAPILQEVDADRAAGLVSEGVTLLDVRTPEEFSKEYIDGAINIDYYGADFRDRIATLDPDEAYLVYCGSGKRSHNATIIMQEMGFRELYDLSDGIAAWKEAGYEVVCEEPVTCPLT